jgi:hypothetical protein
VRSKGGKVRTSRCSINARPDRAEIDAAFFAHTPLSEIVSRFPGTDDSSLSRHRRKCIGEGVVTTVEDISRLAAAAVAVSPAEPVEVVPVPSGSPRDVQIEVQRRLLVQFANCEARKDSRGCALLSVQIRLNAEWLRNDAVKNEPENAPGIHVTWNFAPTRPMRPALEEAPDELPPPATGLGVDAATSVPELPVVAPAVLTDDQVADLIVKQMRGEPVDREERERQEAKARSARPYDPRIETVIPRRRMF